MSEAFEKRVIDPWCDDFDCPPPPVKRPERPACCLPQDCGCINLRTELEPEYVGFDKFVPNIQWEAKGVTAEEAADYARSAAIEFARRAPVLRRRYRMKGQECVQDFFPRIHESEEVWYVEQVKIDGVCVWRREQNTNRCQVQCAGGAAQFEFTAPDMIHLSGGSDMCPANEIEVYAVVSPREDACEIDSTLYNLYKRAIENKALSDLLCMSDKPWSNPVIADKKERRYEQAIALSVSNLRKNDRGSHVSALRGWHI